MAQNAGKAPTFDIYAVLDPEDDANENAKSEWIKLGPIWTTQNKDILSGHINVLPLDAFSARRLHIVIQRRKEKDDASGGSGEEQGSSADRNRNRGRR